LYIIVRGKGGLYIIARRKGGLFRYIILRGVEASSYICIIGEKEASLSLQGVNELMLQTFRVCRGGHE
jgi:hypothetical protein